MAISETLAALSTHIHSRENFFFNKNDWCSGALPSAVSVLSVRGIPIPPHAGLPQPPQCFPVA